LLAVDATTGRTIINTFTVTSISDVQTYVYSISRREFQDALAVTLTLTPTGSSEQHVQVATIFEPTHYHFAVLNRGGLIEPTSIIMNHGGNSRYSGNGLITLMLVEMPQVGSVSVEATSLQRTKNIVNLVFILGTSVQIWA